MTIVNLNKFKKQKAKAQKEINAQNNRIEFGMPKRIKSVAKSENLLEKRRHAAKLIAAKNIEGEIIE